MVDGEWSRGPVYAGGVAQRRAVADSAGLSRLVVPEEANGFLAAHPDMDGDLHRTSKGSGETRVASAGPGVVWTTSTHFGFPVMGELELEAGYVGCGVIVRNDEPLRWRGDEGNAGEAVLFPGSVQVPVSLADDTTMRTVSAPVEAIAGAAEDLGLPLNAPAVRVISGSPLALLDRAIRRHLESVEHARHDPSDDDEILRALAHLLSRPRAVHESRARAESGRVVSSVLDFLVASGRWRLSTLQMCRLANVSERRLQLAFQDMYGVSPHSLLRQRALSACREALLAADDRETKVSDVALDYGFRHLSRFARTYRAAFGELPSETLSRCR